MQALCDKIGFPQEATQFLLETREKMDDAQVAQAVQAFLRRDESYKQFVAQEAQRLSLHEASTGLVILLEACPHIRENYRKKGLPDQLYRDFVPDLLCALQDTKTRHGVWGNSAFAWYELFIEPLCFSLGRLQFELTTWEGAPFMGLETGDRIYSIHIPASGPMTPELVDDALARAKVFFREYDPEYREKTPFYCSSWILYAEQFHLFPEGSNLRRFVDRFTIFRSKQLEYEAAWTIFGCAYDGDPTRLPRNTTLQRNFADHFAAGGKTGYGKGIFFA